MDTGRHAGRLEGGSPLPLVSESTNGTPLPSIFLGRSFAVLAAIACAAAVFAVSTVRGAFLEPPPQPTAIAVLTAHAPAGYAGSQACAGCHVPETLAWKGSQHAHAMQPADAASVLGDFAKAHAEHFGSSAQFLRRNERFIVRTEGKDGKPGEFPVDYTFGVEPLQQYLTTFPDGRVQALPYAWDSRAKDKGGQRWFHLYPNEAIPPGDALHWTGALQNWNYMCADCHSTAVRKNYDAAAKRFDTTFSEVSVGCESCHGAAASHIAWAVGPRDPKVLNKGFAHVAAKRPQADWTPDPISGSPAHGVSRPLGDEVETCGTCHARRGQFAEGWQPGEPLTNDYRPAFLTPDLFEDDGQMRDEVFNYASFQQSKMHAKGVVCSDCHNPHSGKLKAEGSEVCSQCHLPQKFATTSHTGHQAASGAPDCISCHMPSRTYMVVDARHDHSFRIPRPDLSVVLGTPNACTDCHRDKPAQWAASAVERWHGPERKGFQTYAAAFHAFRTGQPDARELLLSVVRDSETPAIARATALASLQGSPSTEVDQTMEKGLSDPDAMVRIAALGGLANLPTDRRWQRASPLLTDPVRAVRLEAATTLAEGPPADATPQAQQAFADAAAEYVGAERFNADRAESRSNLAHFFIRRGKPEDAEREYLEALTLTPSVAPRVDLADLYRMLGRETDAERVLREAIATDAKAAAPQYALGLGLIRQKRYGEAMEALRQAVDLAPAEGRYAYVYALALSSMGDPAQANAVLNRALETNPSDVQILTALLQEALRGGQYKQGLAYANRLRDLLPDDASISGLVDQLKQATQNSPAK